MEWNSNAINKAWRILLAKELPRNQSPCIYYNSSGSSRVILISEEQLVTYIPGVIYIAADHLPRNTSEEFLQKHPYCSSVPVTISTVFLKLASLQTQD